MRLRVVTPSGVTVDRPIRRLLAEAPQGHFGMLPGHQDFVTALVPGILTYETDDGAERFVAVNSGTLVKCGGTVRVAVRGAIEGDDLAHLRRRVEAEFRRQDEDERTARSALARLEAGIVRRFRDLERGRP